MCQCLSVGLSTGLHKNYKTDVHDKMDRSRRRDLGFSWPLSCSGNDTLTMMKDISSSVQSDVDININLDLANLNVLHG